LETSGHRAAKAHALLQADRKIPGRIGVRRSHEQSANSKLLFTSKPNMKSMKEKLEDMVKVSSKGQIILPKDVREKLGVKTGEKLLVLSRDGEILLRKTEEVQIEDIAERIEKQTQQEGIDVDKLLDEAVEWARRSK
jgi:antitoxin PrlF